MPSPVFALAVEPESSAKQAMLDEALHMLTREDPSLRVEVDPESGQVGRLNQWPRPWQGQGES